MTTAITIIEATDQLVAQLEAVAAGEFSRQDKTSIKINAKEAQFIKLIGVQEEYRSGSWRRDPSTGRFFISIGNYGDRKVFKRSQKTGWPAQAIADWVREFCKVEAEQRKRETINKAARHNAEELATEIGSQFIRIEHCPGDTATFYLTYRRPVSKAAALEIAAYLKAGGYL